MILLLYIVEFTEVIEMYIMLSCHARYMTGTRSLSARFPSLACIWDRPLFVCVDHDLGHYQRPYIFI